MQFRFVGFEALRLFSKIFGFLQIQYTKRINFPTKYQNKVFAKFYFNVYFQFSRMLGDFSEILFISLV